MTETRLIPSLAPMSPGFNASFAAWERDFVSRLIITSPYGPIQQQVGGIEPTSNIGIWWKNGTQPYVWDETEKKYVPADVSDSVTEPFWFGATTPTETTPKLWFKTFDTALRGAWHYYDGANWVRTPTLPSYGDSASRPTSPEAYEQYWDTDINCLIHWERSQWRTVSGTPGDVKFVDLEESDYATAVVAATARNPGWSEVRSAIRGRVLGVAGSGAGLTARSPNASIGEETHTMTEAELVAHAHDGLSGLSSANVNGGGPLTNGFMRGDTSTAGVSAWPSSTTNSKGSSTPFNVIQPTFFLVALRKD